MTALEEVFGLSAIMQNLYFLNIFVNIDTFELLNEFSYEIRIDDTFSNQSMESVQQGTGFNIIIERRCKLSV